MSDHGTMGRARKHYRDEGKGWTCEPCRSAWNNYGAAAREAHRILRERHRGEYLRILNELQGDSL